MDIFSQANITASEYATTGNSNWVFILILAAGALVLGSAQAIGGFFTISSLLLNSLLLYLVVFTNQIYTIQIAFIVFLISVAYLTLRLREVIKEIINSLQEKMVVLEITKLVIREVLKITQVYQQRLKTQFYRGWTLDDLTTSNEYTNADFKIIKDVYMWLLCATICAFIGGELQIIFEIGPSILGLAFIFGAHDLSMVLTGGDIKYIVLLGRQSLYLGGLAAYFLKIDQRLFGSIMLSLVICIAYITILAWRKYQNLYQNSIKASFYITVVIYSIAYKYFLHQTTWTYRVLHKAALVVMLSMTYLALYSQDVYQAHRADSTLASNPRLRRDQFMSFFSCFMTITIHVVVLLLIKLVMKLLMKLKDMLEVPPEEKNGRTGENINDTGSPQQDLEAGLSDDTICNPQNLESGLPVQK